MTFKLKEGLQQDDKIVIDSQTNVTAKDYYIGQDVTQEPIYVPAKILSSINGYISSYNTVWNFTRSGAQYEINIGQTFTAFASNISALKYDKLTTKYKGNQLEPARTNLMYASNTISDFHWEGYKTGVTSVGYADGVFTTHFKMIPLELGLTQTQYEQYGEAVFPASATPYSWTVPAGVTSISVLAIGAGGGGCRSTSAGGGGSGGDLRYRNDLTVTPGEVLTIVSGLGGAPGATGAAGGLSSVSRGGTNLLTASGGGGGTTAAPGARNGTSTTISGSIGGGNGGAGGTASGSTACFAGGGAGGYTGDGTAGSSSVNATGTSVGGSTRYNRYTLSGTASYLLSQYGVWNGSPTGSLACTLTYTFYFPTTQNYSIDISADNAAIMYIDDVEVARTPTQDFNTANWSKHFTFDNVAVTAGSRTIRIEAIGDGLGNQSVGAVIRKGGKIIWNTRSSNVNTFFQTYPNVPEYFGDGLGGAGAAGGGGGDADVAGGGGGVGIWGEGLSGIGGAGSTADGYQGGSGSFGLGGHTIAFANGSSSYRAQPSTSYLNLIPYGQHGGLYGGGGGGDDNNVEAGFGGDGVVRIIWKNSGTDTREFPSTNVADDGIHYIYSRLASAVTAGNKYTFSIFAKPNGYNFIRLEIPGSNFGENVSNALFNIATGQHVSSGNISNYYIEPYVNGWYRVSITTPDCITTGSVYPRIYAYTDEAMSHYKGERDKGILLQQAQFELGEFPSSPIVTTTAVATRGINTISMKPEFIANQVMQFNLNEGTLVFNGYTSEYNAVSDGGSSPSLISISDGTPSNRFIIIRNVEDNNINVRYYDINYSEFITVIDAPCSNDTIYCVGISYSASKNKIKVLLNIGGVLYTGEVDGTLNNKTSLIMGSNYVGTAGAWGGTLSDIRWYAKSFNFDQMRTITNQLYNSLD